MPLSQTPLNLINRHGITGTYVPKSTSVYDPATSSTIQTSATPVSVKMYLHQERNRNGMSPNIVAMNDPRILISGIALQALGVVPKKGDTLTYDAETYEVLEPNRHYADGVVALWILEVKK